MKKRIRKKSYYQHARHVLEKTQTETYMEFCDLHPEVKVKQRKFEGLKPFYVKQAKGRDHKSCLCQKHIETKIVLNDCMKFCKVAIKNDDQTFRVPKMLTEVVEMTLCAARREQLNGQDMSISQPENIYRMASKKRKLLLCKRK